MSAKSPAFQFYPNEFLGGRVATYTLEEIGAYMTLLSFDWTLSGLPVEPEKIARLLRISRRKLDSLWQTIGDQFPIDGDRRCNPRLQLERKKQAAYSAKMSANGKKGGKPKLSRGKADVKPNESFSSSSSITTSLTGAPDGAAGEASERPDGWPSFANWPADYGDEWIAANGGTAPFGRIGKALAPLIARDGPEYHWPAWCRFVRSPKAQYGPEYFAAHRRDFDPPPPRLAMTSAGVSVMSPAEHEAYKRAELESINARRKARGEAPLVA